ncbi:MAG: MFS transporter [Betaproteobacteria bacterium]
MSAAVPDGRTALVALAATLAIQMFTSLVATAPAVLAPELARSMGVAPQWIGVFVGLVYLGAMFASVVSAGFIERFGAIRVSQFCVLLCAVGIMAIGLLPATFAGLLVGIAVLIGLGYGPITPASSQILVRTTPASQMALMFSIKQTGVPAGAALAGALLPVAALAFGWRIALITLSLIGLGVIVAAQSTRRVLDVDRTPGQAFSLAAMIGRLKLVARTPELAELALLSLAYAAVQVCLTSFLVVFLNGALGWSLVDSGLALTVATIGGVIGRIVWGALADRVLAPRRALTLIGLLAGLCGLGMAFATPLWPAWIILPVAALFGATAIGWNGVQLSELARRAPPGSAGAVTGAAGFITFSGVVMGPPIFAALTAVTGGYRAGFLFMATISLVAASMLHFWTPAHAININTPR